ncbi:MAG: hypothetical protein AAB403_06280 [Planctomycetota bacterium]
MVRKMCKAVTLLFVFTTGAAGQIDPKALLAGKTLDFSQARTLPFGTTDRTFFENVLVEGRHYAIVMAWKNTKLEPDYVQLLATVQIPFRTIAIDGLDNDWAGISPVVSDPAGDVNPAAQRVGTDLANVYMARDASYLYIRMTLHDGNPRQDTLYFVELQQYLTQLSTPGDVMIGAAYESGPDWHIWLAARGPGRHRYYNGTDVAVGTKMLEWKVPISDVQYPPNTPRPYFPPSPPGPQGIEGRFIRSYVHPMPGATTPVADENDRLTRPLIVNFYSAATGRLK